MCEFQDAYDEGVGEAQAFIDRHPHGYPAMTMEQYGKPVRPEDELEAEHMRGWFERLGDERGTEADPNESWKRKMQAFDLWPDWID